jgi:hypothetical protein
MFGVQRDRVARGIGGAGGRAEIARAGRLGDCAGLGLVQQESGVGGKDDMRGRTAPARGETGKIAGFGVTFDAGDIGFRFDRFDQAVQAARAGLKPFAFQFGHHRLNLVQAEFAIFNLARQFKRELKHRIEQRRFFGGGVQILQTLRKGGNLAHLYSTLPVRRLSRPLPPLPFMVCP